LGVELSPYTGNLEVICCSPNEITFVNWDELQMRQFVIFDTIDII